ncbi:MAG: hypothetical protein WBM52_15995, partial [Thiogranum sp.]
CQIMAKKSKKQQAKEWVNLLYLLLLFVVCYCLRRTCNEDVVGSTPITGSILTRAYFIGGPFLLPAANSVLAH